MPSQPTPGANLEGVMQPPDVKPARVLIVEDQAIMRAGLRMIIESQPGLTVCGEAETGDEALTIAAREGPDVILLDLDLMGKSALDFLPALLAAAAGARIIILTGLLDEDQYVRALQLGAKGVVLKLHTVPSLVRAIQKVQAGEVWLNGAIAARALDRLSHPRGSKEADPEAAKIATLTEREREIIRLLGKGLKNQQLAEHLFMSEGTVRNRLTVIFDKLGVGSRVELIVYAYQHGLSKPPFKK